MEFLLADLDWRAAILQHIVSIVPLYFRPGAGLPAVRLPGRIAHSFRAPIQDSTRPKEKEKAYLRNKHPITSSNAHRQALALLVERARPNSQHLALVKLLDARLGQEEAARRLGLGLDALDQHAVQQRHERPDGADRGGLVPGGEKVSQLYSSGQVSVMGARLRLSWRTTQRRRIERGLATAFELGACRMEGGELTIV